MRLQEDRMLDDLKRSNVLVLGGAGFIGQHVCKSLLDAGACVRCLDRRIPPGHGVLNDLIEDVDWVLGEFSDAEKLARALDGMDYVVHLISTTIPDTSNKELQYDLSSNVFPTLGLLESMRFSSVRKLLFISSGGTIYGIPSIVPIPESHETNPVCGYGIHKLAIEKYLNIYKYRYGLDYCVLRLANPYGEAQISDRPQGVIGKFIYKAIHNEKLEIWGDGGVIRDYVYIEDVMDAIRKALLYRGSRKIFNIGSGTGNSLQDIIGTIEQTAGYTLDVAYLPQRQVDLPLNVLDITNARTELLWSPVTDLATGIRHLYEYGSSTMLYPLMSDFTIREVAR
jgi:UDP-glucose 4-epimerase